MQNVNSRESRSPAQRLKVQIEREKGKRKFRHQGFHAIDREGKILEKSFHESGETVQVHLTRGGKVQSVFLIRH